MAVAEIERSMVGADDLPDLDDVLAKKPGVPKTRAKQPPKKQTPMPKVEGANQFANPPGLEVLPGESIFKVEFQWAGIGGIINVAAKTKEAAIEILVGHFRRRCRTVG